MLNKFGLNAKRHFSILIFCTCLSSNSYGNIYTEIGDAGSLPATAQSTTDSNQVFDEIKGTLTPLSGDGVDMFKIYINGGGDFSAKTIGGVSFDSELYLFKSNGIGVYANDDTTGYLTPSVLPANNPLTPIEAGYYYLAISQCCSQPLSSAGAIFTGLGGGADHLDLSGPTGPGGSLPVTSFTNTFDQSPGGGNYTIFLTGAQLATVPLPTSIWLFGSILFSFGLLKNRKPV